MGWLEIGTTRSTIHSTRSTLAAHSMAVTSAICSERAAKLYLQEDPPRCMLANETKLLLSRALANSVAVGDEITFPIPEFDAIGPEILVSKNSHAGPTRYLYQAPVEYVSRPKQDKRDQYFVSAEVQQGSLGISSIFLPCEILREYFYRLPRSAETAPHPTLYELLRIPPSRLHLNCTWRSSSAIWSSNRWAPHTQNERHWSGHSTSLAIRNCAPAMTRC